MLTLLVIVSRQPGRSAPCSRLSASSPVTISPVVHPVSVQQLTKCSSRKSFFLKTIHFDGGCAPLALPLTTTTPSSVYPNLLFPFFSHICALFCAILHFLARIKYATLFFSSDSALFGKNTWGGVPPLSPRSKMKRFPAISEASPARSTHPASASGLGCPFVADFVGMRILRLLALGFGTDAGVFEGDHAFREGFVFE